jgi:hypothetical protein
MDMTEKVISVYDADDAETIENGVDAAREAADADTYGEAVAELARAYTGWHASDSDDGR